ncbi:DUF2142 domain-containing protein [Candidatus Woesebacteria bacterium]|nr:DUF2142 domain-containing protein [Candidatus Woesebacteria bacterium]
MSKEVIKFTLAIVGVILGWVMVVPIFEFPDEQAHFGSISYLISNNFMPDYGKEDLTVEMAETQKLLGVFRNDVGQNKYTYHPEYHPEYTSTDIGLYEDEIKSLNSQENRDTYVGSEAAKYPPLYYALGSLYTRIVDRSDIMTRVFVTRFINLDIAVLMAMVVWNIGLITFDKKIYARLLTFMVMLQPMMSFVTAGINSDNLHNLLFFTIIYLGLRIIKYELKFKDLLALVIVIVLDIYTKPQGFIGIAVAGLSVLLAVIRSRKWTMLGWIAFIGLGAILVGGSQWETYQGLFSVGNTHGATFIEYVRFTANKLLAQNVVWYWGVFKWLGVVLPPIYWRVANRIVLVSVIGLVVYWWRTLKKKSTIADPYSIFFVLCSSILYALIIFWYDWQHTKQNGYSLGIQARYFFPTIVAHMSILITGVMSLTSNLKLQSWIRTGLVLLFTWLQLGGLWRIISIYYPGANLSEIITMASQYKPELIKGEWWYLWIAIYVISLLYLLRISLSQDTQKVAKKIQK